MQVACIFFPGPVEDSLFDGSGPGKHMAFGRFLPTVHPRIKTIEIQKFWDSFYVIALHQTACPIKSVQVSFSKSSKSSCQLLHTVIIDGEEAVVNISKLTILSLTENWHKSCHICKSCDAGAALWKGSRQQRRHQYPVHNHRYCVTSITVITLTSKVIFQQGSKQLHFYLHLPIQLSFCSTITPEPKLVYDLSIIFLSQRYS